MAKGAWRPSKGKFGIMGDAGAKGKGNTWRPSKGKFGVFGNAKGKLSGGNTWRPSKGQWGMFGNAKGSKAAGRKGKGGLFGKSKVQSLQTGLNDQGATPPLKVDGDYGPKTRGAVDEFNAKQEQNIY